MLIQKISVISRGFALGVTWHLPEEDLAAVMIKNMLKETKRVLNNDGLVLITITSTFWSKTRHALSWWDKKQNRIKKDMKYGFSKKELTHLLEENGFKIIEKKRFLMGVSRLFIARPKPD